MEYPRIKIFNFQYDRTYIVPSHYVGRLDLISYELYRNIPMYKPLAYANNIALTMGLRTGIRRTEDALQLELINKGFSGSELEAEYTRIMDEKRLINLDWYAYNDNSYGMMSDVTEGRVLQVPTFESAQTWLRSYERLEKG